jgi:hypothetical protein
LRYLRSHIGPDGLFRQRLETSKHAGNLNLGDTRTRAYMNILLWDVFMDAARIAEHLNLKADSRDATQTADTIRRALFDRLWDKAGGFFRDALETPSFGFEANALALAMKLVSPEQAARMASALVKNGHGKFQALASRGKFEYGFAQSGLRALFDHNWLRLLDDTWTGAAATTECMGMITRGWGDESHPDTAIADHFSAYLLGVQPTAPGFDRFLIRPLPVQEVNWAKGVVPSPHGPIVMDWVLSGNTFRLTLTVPPGTVAEVILPRGCDIRVNGAPGDLGGLKPGQYVIEARDLPAGAWNDPTLAAMVPEKVIEPVIKASSTDEGNGWELAGILKPALPSQGYRSKPHTSDRAAEWIEIDLGSETALSKIVLLPCRSTPTNNESPGFPRDFTVQFARTPGAYSTVVSFSDQPAPGPDGLTIDLYTVIGYPSARYVRLAASRLGRPSCNEPGRYRLQLRGIQLVRP